MANNHSTLTSLFSDIADSIREKTGDATTIVADEFPTAIDEISAVEFGTPKTFGDYAVGDSVYLNVNGVSTEFLVVHQGLPSDLYDSSCNGTWLLMNDLYEKRVWDSSNNNYANSDIHTYLNGTFFGLFDSDIQSSVKQVKIPYQSGTGSGGSVASGSEGLSAKIFLLSGYEVGWTTNNDSHFPVDGACLSYFSGTSATDSKRIGYYNGTATIWWLRSSYISLGNCIWCVETNGSHMNYDYAFSHGVRPAFVLDSSASPESAPVGSLYLSPDKQTKYDVSKVETVEGGMIAYVGDVSLGTATAADVAEGVTFTSDEGVNVTGTLEAGIDILYFDKTANNSLSYVLNPNVDVSGYKKILINISTCHPSSSKQRQAHSYHFLEVVSGATVTCSHNLAVGTFAQTFTIDENLLLTGARSGSGISAGIFVHVMGIK